MTMTETPPAAVEGVPVEDDVDDPQPGDSIELLSTGRVRIKVVDDATSVSREVVLRRPTLGQYRALREKYDEEVADDELRKAEHEAAGGGGTFDGTVGIARWTLAALDMLAPEHGFDELAMPTWFAAPALVPALLGHWRAVPLARSSKATPQRASQ